MIISAYTKRTIVNELLHQIYQTYRNVHGLSMEIAEQAPEVINFIQEEASKQLDRQLLDRHLKVI